MDGNQNLYAYCFVQGILEMKEPPALKHDALPSIKRARWWPRLWKHLNRSRTRTSHQNQLSRKQG